MKASEERASTPNPQRIERAPLPENTATLAMPFHLTVRNVLDGITSCNDLNVESRIVNFLRDYRDTHNGLAFLGRLYAKRIASGAFLWRNLEGRNLRVRVQIDDERYNGGQREAFDFKPREESDAVAIMPASGNEADYRDDRVEALAQYIAGCLSADKQANDSPEDAVGFLHVEGRVDMAPGEEVFPSQEFAQGQTRYEVGRILAKDDQGRARMHSQKIGNAVRSIDKWHPYVKQVGPISMEAFGATRRYMQAFRYNTKNPPGMSFKKCLERVIQSGTDAELGDDRHFMTGVLIRGGVFGMKSD